MATTSTTTAQPGHAEPTAVAYAGVGKYPTPRYPDSARSIKDIALEHGPGQATLVHWRERLPTTTTSTGDHADAENLIRAAHAA